jgi:hypothetical protein
MEKYVGEALYVMRFEDDAIARTKDRYGKMISDPCTTLWEHWGRRNGTDNHGWSGGALTLLSQYAAGVAPTTPGYATYHVLPQMGPLKMIRTTVPSVKGDITLELLDRPDAFQMTLTSPENTTATVGIPRSAGDITRIEANKTLVWGNGKALSTVDGLVVVERTAEYITFSVRPGTWVFTAMKAARHNSVRGAQQRTCRPILQRSRALIYPSRRNALLIEETR